MAVCRRWPGTNGFICFEMSALITKPRALAAVLSYCFHALETHWLTGEPVVVAIDEAKWLLAVLRFLGEVEVWLKARAKMNLSVWLATQELYDVQGTTLWQAVLANMPTKILLPNPQALRAAVRPFYADIGVQRLWRAAVGAGATLSGLSLCLAPGDAAVSVYPQSGRAAPVCRQSVGGVGRPRPDGREIPAHALPAAWLRQWGYDEEAALLHTPNEGDPL